MSGSVNERKETHAASFGLVGEGSDRDYTYKELLGELLDAEKHPAYCVQS